MTKKIRWGILGPGKIAQSFANDLNLVPESELVAVGSRNKERAQTFASEYNIDNVFGTYQELLSFDGVDVIYIATPHTGHMEWAIEAMQNGKHVLCEKPLGINLEQVQKMISVAKENKVFLMEALWSRFNPTIRKVKQLVNDGVIGDLSYLHADFAFYGLDRDEKGRVLNPELGGGTLLDIGIYPIFLSYLLMGKPERIQASSKFHTNGAEIQTSMIFDYSKAQAVLYSGLSSKSEMKAEISGTTGAIFVHPRWHEAKGYTLEKNDELENFSIPTDGNGYTYEIEEVNACLMAGKLQSDLWSHQNSTDLMELLDEVRKITGVVFPFE